MNRGDFINKKILGTACGVSLAALMLSAVPAPVARAYDAEEEMNAWFDASKDVALGLASEGSSTALTWYVSLQMMQDILNDNEYMVHGGQFDDIRCGYGHFFDAENHYQSCMIPLDFDTNERYNRILLCHTSVGDIYASINNDGDSNTTTYLSYSRYTGAMLEISAAYGTTSPPVTITIEGDATGYFTNTAAWNRSFVWGSPWSSSYPIQVTTSTRVETVQPNYTPYITGNYMQFGDLCGQYSEISMSDLNIEDIAVSELYTPAALQDFIVTEWLPGFQAAFPDAALPPLPVDPSSTTVTLPPVGAVTDSSGQPVTVPAGAGDYEYSVEIPNFRTFTVPEPPEMTMPTTDSPALGGVYGILDRLLNSAGLVPFLVIACVIGALIVVARG